MLVRVLREVPRRSSLGSLALRAHMSTPCPHMASAALHTTRASRASRAAAHVARLCTKARDWEHESKVAAHEALKDAVKELSEGEEVPLSYSPTVSLLEWDKTPMVQLSTEQLEELARACFEGVPASPGVPGMPQDHTRAVEIWTEAAARGSVEARYSRAVCLREGRGVSVDAAMALAEMRGLADTEDYALAHYAAAIMLSTGEGAEPDLEGAFHYFQQSARGGITPALHNLGNAYASGLGTPADPTKALLYYEGAVEAGDPFAKFTLGTWLYHGRGELVIDKVRAFQLQKEAAEEGHPGAMFNTGAALMEGSVVEKDLLGAAGWFEKAMDRNVIQGAVNLGNMHRHGAGVPRDLRKALEIFCRFASDNEVCAQLALDTEQQIEEESR
jgi:TPR repeat protein